MPPEEAASMLGSLEALLPEESSDAHHSAESEAQRD